MQGGMANALGEASVVGGYIPLTLKAHLGASLGGGQSLGEFHFDQPPTRGEIGVVQGEFDYAMQVVGQHRPAMNNEGLPVAAPPPPLRAAIRYDGSAGHCRAVAVG